jgi:hypothetical protein
VVSKRRLSVPQGPSYPFKTVVLQGVLSEYFVPRHPVSTAGLSQLKFVLIYERAPFSHAGLPLCVLVTRILRGESPQPWAQLNAYTSASPHACTARNCIDFHIYCSTLDVDFCIFASLHISTSALRHFGHFLQLLHFCHSPSGTLRSVKMLKARAVLHSGYAARCNSPQKTCFTPWFALLRKLLSAKFSS